MQLYIDDVPEGRKLMFVELAPGKDMQLTGTARLDSGETVAVEMPLFCPQRPGPKLAIETFPQIAPQAALVSTALQMAALVHRAFGPLGARLRRRAAAGDADAELGR